ncbi:MAG: TlyA family RNA methyltransferase [Thermodesulfobacteriota bacterium]|nr:TlyA family RNA methyltransferase [Thermodesulfobacteriota bacterium]
MKPETQKSKIRLDRLLVDRGIAVTREKAKALIMSGLVVVEEERIDKAGTFVRHDAWIRIKGGGNPYVSRGGLKLKGALLFFDVDAKDIVAMDIGASTGGFTDCLIQEGAKKVYAIDVGYGQIDWKLRTDSRVILFEKTNFRYFSGDGIEDKIDMAVIDVSFISLKLILPVAFNLTGEDATIIALIKPQFEAGRDEAGKGVIRDPMIHIRVVEEIVSFSEKLGLKTVNTCESPITGPAGNKEFFLYARKSDTEMKNGN